MCYLSMVTCAESVLFHACEAVQQKMSEDAGLSHGALVELREYCEGLHASPYISALVELLHFDHPSADIDAPAVGIGVATVCF